MAQLIDLNINGSTPRLCWHLIVSRCLNTSCPGGHLAWSFHLRPPLLAPRALLPSRLSARAPWDFQRIRALAAQEINATAKASRKQASLALKYGYPHYGWAPGYSDIPF